MPPCAGPFGEIAMVPDVREALEIGVVIFASRRVVPEADRHRRERPACRPVRPCRSPSACRPPYQTSTAMPRPRRLDLAAPDRQRSDRRPRSRTRCRCRPRSRRAGRRLDRVDRHSRSLPAPAASRSMHQPHGRRSCVVARPTSSLRRRRYISPTCRTASCARACGDNPTAPSAPGETASHRIEEERRAAGEARDQPVPHHPAAGGEIEQPVARSHVAMQSDVLSDAAAAYRRRRMHDAFGHAGGAGRIEDIERMIERQPLERQCSAAA